MAIHERQFGRAYEDFEVGDVYKHWPGKTITEYDDHLFCMMAQAIHSRFKPRAQQATYPDLMGRCL
jgi:hypothetical protein